MSLFYVLSNEPDWQALAPYHKVVVDMHHEKGNLRKKAADANRFIQNGGQISMYLNSALQKDKPGYEEAMAGGFCGKRMDSWNEHYVKSGCYSNPKLQNALLKQLDDWQAAGLDKKGVRVFVDNCDYEGTSPKDMAGFFVAILKKGYAVEGQNLPVAVAKALAQTPEGRNAIAQGRVFHSLENVVLHEPSEAINRTMEMHHMGIRMGSFTEYLRNDITGGGKNFTWNQATKGLNQFYMGLREAGMPRDEVRRLNALHFISPDQKVGRMPDPYQQAQAIHQKANDAMLDRGMPVGNTRFADKGPIAARHVQAAAHPGWTINAPAKTPHEQPRTRWHIDLAGDTAPKSKPA